MSVADKITIVTVCDNHYTVMLAALIKSIEVNHSSGECIDIYVVTDKVSKKNIGKLISSVASPLIKLIWLKMESIFPSDLKLPLDGSSFPLNVYARLFIPHFVPENIDRVLYLDVDMIVLKDISILWKTNLQNRMVAGVIDRAETVANIWGGITNYKELHIQPDTKYFNSGLLIIDTFKWRDFHIAERVIECVNKNKKYAGFPDQYGLNVILANQWYELDPKWNTYAVLFEKNPFIIHFIGRKPIYNSYSYNQLYEIEFYKYLKLTAWSNFKPLTENSRMFKKILNKVEKLLKK